MAILEWIALALSAAVLAVWVTRIFAVHSTKAWGPVLSQGTIPDVPPSGKVSIILPAKDEEANIAAALATLQTQDYPDVEIIVVDDRSRDRTAKIVQGVAATDPRVRLVQVTELPAGWFGKPHAMHAGAAVATGQWLLFVDADCRQAPHSARAAAAFLQAHSGDMLSLWPVLEMHGFWENAVQPVAGSVLVAYFRPGWVNDPRRRVAFANGQYIMIRRSTYEAVGGYASVRDALVEDITLARRVKGLGYRLWNVTGKDLFTTRMYDTLGAMYLGWSRIYSGAFSRIVMLAVVMVFTPLMTLAPFVALAAAAVALAQGEVDPFWHGLFFLNLACAGVLLVTMRRLMIAGRANPWYLAYYPVSVLLVMGFEAGAMLRVLGLRPVTWRGTTYKGGRVVGENGTANIQQETPKKEG
jgi:cellulose synthase/poly-beta-1,6-N-acetylglucosamine synthase-like glycosyltransferase